MVQAVELGPHMITVTLGTATKPAIRQPELKRTTNKIRERGVQEGKLERCNGSLPLLGVWLS
jgi:hypothetical protein